MEDDQRVMIAVEHLTKRYGELAAVEDLSFQIGEGHVYGFLGPNGAGKSTTMNIMAGCLSATAGTVRIDGHDIFEDPKGAKSCIGYLPEQPPLYGNDTPEEYLAFVGEAKGLRGEALRQQLREVTERTGIGPVRHRRIGELSKGYRQRVGIAQALLGRPGFVILDEPTVGLDPHQILEIRELIRELGESHTVLFSSHILSEVQTLCDQILILSRGKLVAFDTPENLEKQLLAPGEICLVAETGEEALRAILGKMAHITRLRVEPCPEGTAAAIQTDLSDLHVLSREIFLAFANAGTALLELAVKRATLEDVFLELTAAGGETEKEKEGKSA